MIRDAVVGIQIAKPPPESDLHSASGVVDSIVHSKYCFYRPMSDQEPSLDEIPLADQAHLYDPYALTFSALPEDVAKEMAEAILRIRAMYDAGVALYTKETLADISQQIETVDKGRQNICERDQRRDCGA